LRLIECGEPRELDVWLSSAIHVAKAINPYLAPDDAGAVWLRIVRSPCYSSLYEFQKRWIGLLQAVAARDAARMAELGSAVLDADRELGAEARQYALMAAMSGHVAGGNKSAARLLWKANKD